MLHAITSTQQPHNAAPQPESISELELAIHLNLGVKTMLNYRKAGKLPPHFMADVGKSRKQVRYLLADVQTFEAALQKTTDIKKRHEPTKPWRFLFSKNPIPVYQTEVNYEFINRDDLSRVYDNTLIKVGEKEVYKNTRDIFANHFMAWAKNPNSRSYTGGVIFLPGRVAPPDYFNTWRGFSVNPKQNDALLTPIYGHMKDVVCAGHLDLYHYFIKWIAYTTQNPDKPAGAALVLRGEKGSGKGTIGHFLKAIWDNHGLHITSPKHLVGNFNAHLNDVCFLFADEAFFSGDHAAEGILKGLITEPSLMIERKGIDAITQPNYLKILMATNSDWAVPATKDERRFCIMDVSSAHIGNREYFNKLWSMCHSKEVQAAFLYAMLNIDLTDFHTGDIPDSIGLREQRYHSMRPHQQWLADSLVNGTFNALDETGNPDDWHEELSSDELFKKYVEWCDRAKIGEFRRVAQCVLGGYLGKIYPGKRHVVKNKRGYCFGDMAHAISLFEDYEKVDLDELG